MEEQQPQQQKGLTAASELKSGSVMDFFAKKQPSSSDLGVVWECSECLIKNAEREKCCVACKSARPDDDDSDDIEILECPSDEGMCEVFWNVIDFGRVRSIAGWF